jgi:hypothetical protein
VVFPEDDILPSLPRLFYDDMNRKYSVSVSKTLNLGDVKEITTGRKRRQEMWYSIRQKKRAFFENYSVFQIQANESP